MPRHTAIDPSILEAALIGLEHQKSEIEAKTAEIRRRLRGLPAASEAGAPRQRGAKRRLSAAARKRIAKATKKRWAEYRAKKAAAAAKKPARKAVAAKAEQAAAS